MKQFLLFAGDQYYPSGGWSDFQGDFDSVDAAKAHLPLVQEVQRLRSPWWQIVDTKTFSIVACN